MSIRGIDVSSYQAEHPPLGDAAFCFVKATEGTGYVNPRMRAQADYARKHGLVVGFYHFQQPGDPKGQARYFVEKCASLKGDPLWCDWEVSGVSCAEKDAFLREVVRLRGDAHRVGLYCSQSYWLHHDTTSYCADALWIANYNGHPGKPGIRDPWLFHQYTSSPIDTSVGQFANRAALRAWCTDTKTKAPATKAPSTSKEKNMSLTLNTSVPLNDWLKRWDDLKDGHITVRTALGSGYGHARRAGDAAEQAVAELGALRGTLDKLVEKIGAGGLTAAEVQSAAEAGAKSALAQLGKTLTDKES